jgi:hypothetical protein
MCNCGSTAQAKDFVFTDPKTGRQHTYSTRIEAQAAQVRAGGGGSIREVPRP